MGDIITQQLTKAEEARAAAVVRLLDDWAHWQRGYSPNTGYCKKSAGFSADCGTVTDESSGQQQDAAEIDRCEIVDRCIDDLANASHKAAIHRCYLSAVYRMRDYEQSLSDAHDALTIAFKKKGILW